MATVHFTIDGDWLTGYVRQLVLEGRPGLAWRTATTLRSPDPDGPSAHEIALAVLEGTKRLVSEDDAIVAIDEEPATMAVYTAGVRRTYAGVFRHGQRWIRPAARTPSGQAELMKLPDEVVIVGIDDVVWVPCFERPHWMPEVTTAVDALTEAVAYGYKLTNRDAVIPDEDDDDVDEDVDIDDLDVTVIDAQLEELQAEAEAERRAVQDAEWAAYARRLEQLRARINEQAAGDTLTLSWDEDGETQSATVARAPFVHWALDRRSKLRGLAPAWTPVSPMGLKLPYDDPYHTDWLLSSGLDLAVAYEYSHPMTKAALDKAVDIQLEIGQSQCAVLVEGKFARGPIHVGKRKKASPPGSVVVLPNLHPDYLPAVVDAAAVIAQVGGATAHLAQVGRDRALPLPMVIIRDALKRFTEAMTVTVDTADAVVEIVEVR